MLYDTLLKPPDMCSQGLSLVAQHIHDAHNAADASALVKKTPSNLTPINCAVCS